MCLVIKRLDGYYVEKTDLCLKKIFSESATRKDELSGVFFNGP